MRQPVSGNAGGTSGGVTGKYWTISTACAGADGPSDDATTTARNSPTIAPMERADERMDVASRGRTFARPLEVCVDDLLGAEIDEHARAWRRRLPPHHHQPVSVVAARRLAVDERENLESGAGSGRQVGDGPRGQHDRALDLVPRERGRPIGFGPYVEHLARVQVDDRRDGEARGVFVAGDPGLPVGGRRRTGRPQ